jgi:hypothetical protein
LSTETRRGEIAFGASDLDAVAQIGERSPRAQLRRQ